MYSSPAGLLSSISINSGTVQFTAAAVPGLRYVIEATTNLLDWVPLATLFRTMRVISTVLN